MTCIKMLKVPPPTKADSMIQTSDIVMEKKPKVPPLFQDGLLDNEDYLPSGLVDKYAEEQDNRGDHPGRVSDWERHRGIGECQSSWAP